MVEPLLNGQDLGQARSEWHPGSRVSAGFAVSQSPSAQLPSYGSLDEVVTSLSLDFFCEVRIKLVYPKGIQALLGMIGLNVDGYRLKPKAWPWLVLHGH